MLVVIINRCYTIKYINLLFFIVNYKDEELKKKNMCFFFEKR